MGGFITRDASHRLHPTRCPLPGPSRHEIKGVGGGFLLEKGVIGQQPHRISKRCASPFERGERVQWQSLRVQHNDSPIFGRPARRHRAAPLLPFSCVSPPATLPDSTTSPAPSPITPAESILAGPTAPSAASRRSFHNEPAKNHV